MWISRRRNTPMKLKQYMAMLIIATYATGAFFLPAQAGTIEEMLKDGTAVQYQRVALYDQYLNCEAMRSLAPVGWIADGQVYWAMQSGTAPATIDFFITPPDGSARAGVVSLMSFCVPDTIYQLTEGQWYAPGLCPVKAWQNAATYAENYFREYTGLSNVQLIETLYPQGAEAQAFYDYLTAYNQMMAGQVAELQQIAQSQGASFQVENYIDAAQVVLRFDFNGTPCKAKASVCILTTEYVFTSYIPYYGYVTERTYYWKTAPLGFNYYFATEANYDNYEAAADLFLLNSVANEQWHNAIQQASDVLFQKQTEWTIERVRAEHDAMIARSKAITETLSQNYNYSSSMSDAIHKAMDGWTNVVTDRSYYEGPDGGVLKLDDTNRYGYSYSDGSGGIIQSSEALQNLPTGWSALNEIGPMLP